SLRHRIGVGPLSSQRRQQIPLDLLRRPARQHVVSPADVPPDRVRVPTQLLLDEHLLQVRPPSPAQLHRMVSAVHLPPRALIPPPAPPPLAQPPAGQLRRHLERDQHLVDERRRPIPQLPLAIRQREVHSSSSSRRRSGASCSSSSRSAGTSRYCSRSTAA